MESVAAARSPEALFNVLSKTIGLYWFVYGVLTCIDMAYAAFVGRVQQMTVYSEDATYTVLWGVAMLAVGALLIIFSRSITQIAFAFDSRATAGRDKIGDDGLEKQ